MYISLLFGREVFVSTQHLMLPCGVVLGAAWKNHGKYNELIYTHTQMILCL